MDQAQPQLTLEESVKQVMQTLPPVIRAYLAQGKYTVVAQNLMAKYGLRIDQGGILEREIMLLLMGIDTPDEFTQVLVEEAKLDQKIVAGIVQDINTQVFVPLRAEEMKSVVGNAQSPAGAPRPPAVPGAGGQPETHFHLENKIAPPPRPLAAVPAKPSARPALRDVLSAVMKTPEPMSGGKLLEDHEEPHINLGVSNTAQEVRNPIPTPPPKSSVPPSSTPPRFTPPGMRPKFTPAPNLPPRVIVPPPAPATSAPPAAPNLAPSAMKAPPVLPSPTIPAVPKIGVPAAPIAPIVPVSPKPGVPLSAPITPSVPAKPYAGDPYREPIEP